MIQLAGFGTETTYGMELEFVNRWLTPLPKGKEATRLELKDGVAFQQPVQSPEMTITGDDGRGSNTVLEIESRVFAEEDWKNNKVHASVEAILAHASDIIKYYRGQQPALLEEERAAASVALGRPVDVDVLEQAKSLAAELAKRLPELDKLAEAQDSYETAFRSFVEEQSKANEDELERSVAKLEQMLHKIPESGRSLKDRLIAVDKAIAEIAPASKLLRALQPIVNGVGEKSKATLQVTTLGRKGPQHTQALAQTSAGITELNMSRKGDQFDLVNPLQTEANSQAQMLIEELKPQGEPQVLEDFRVTLESAVKIVMFSEKGISGYGTVKNMPFVLPRRIIIPPPKGFAVALSMDILKYEKAISELQLRLKQTDLAKDNAANDILLMLSQGMNEQASEEYAKRVEKWEKGEGQLQGYDRRFSLWTVEGGVPTLEADIIRRAAKEQPENWTAHELRQFGWATGMTAGELKPYLDLLKRKATER